MRPFADVDIVHYKITMHRFVMKAAKTIKRELIQHLHELKNVTVIVSSKVDTVLTKVKNTEIDRDNRMKLHRLIFKMIEHYLRQIDSCIKIGRVDCNCKSVKSNIEKFGYCTDEYRCLNNQINNLSASLSLPFYQRF